MHYKVYARMLVPCILFIVDIVEHTHKIKILLVIHHNSTRHTSLFLSTVVVISRSKTTLGNVCEDQLRFRKQAHKTRGKLREGFNEDDKSAMEDLDYFLVGYGHLSKLYSIQIVPWAVAGYTWDGESNCPINKGRYSLPIFFSFFNGQDEQGCEEVFELGVVHIRKVS